MLEGKTVNLRVIEKEDFPLLIEWNSKPEFWGEFFSPFQRSRTEMEKALSEPGQYEFRDFLIEK